MSKALDVREEVLETALTYLQLVSAPDIPRIRPDGEIPDPAAASSGGASGPSEAVAIGDGSGDHASGSGPLLRLLPDIRCSLSIGFYKTDPHELSERSPLVSVVLELGKKGRGSGRWAVAVADVVRRLGCSFSVRTQIPSTQLLRARPSTPPSRRCPLVITPQRAQPVVLPEAPARCIVQGPQKSNNQRLSTLRPCPRPCPYSGSGRQAVRPVRRGRGVVRAQRPRSGLPGTLSQRRFQFQH